MRRCLSKLLIPRIETSENEDDVFADASEGQGTNSVPNSPIPMTRVEKVSQAAVDF